MTVPRTAAAVALGATALGLSTAALPVSAAPPRAHAARGATVTLRNLAFHPRTVHVRRGGTVTWVWRDGATAHNVTGARFHSRTQSRGTFRVRFAHAGTFRFHCTIHPFMTGKVVVR